jgi:hypothetical protein
MSLGACFYTDAIEIALGPIFLQQVQTSSTADQQRATLKLRASNPSEIGIAEQSLRQRCFSPRVTAGIAGQ